MIQVSQADLFLAVMLADIRSFKATKRSLGVVYGMLIGVLPSEDPLWREINRVVLDSRSGDQRYLEHVKKIGWDLHAATAISLRAAEATA